MLKWITLKLCLKCLTTSSSKVLRFSKAWFILISDILIAPMTRDHESHSRNSEVVTSFRICLHSVHQLSPVTRSCSFQQDNNKQVITAQKWARTHSWSDFSITIAVYTVSLSRIRVVCKHTTLKVLYYKHYKSFLGYFIVCFAFLFVFFGETLSIMLRCFSCYRIRCINECIEINK